MAEIPERWKNYYKGIKHEHLLNRHILRKLVEELGKSEAELKNMRGDLYDVRGVVTGSNFAEMQQRAEVAEARNRELEGLNKNLQIHHDNELLNKIFLQGQVQRLKDALGEIRSMNFAKDEKGRDDFYSGAPRFISAWLKADAALAPEAKGEK